MMYFVLCMLWLFFFFSSRRRHTRCALVTGVQTCALPILPSGATPVDFAYYLHTDLGHRCRGARVDGQLVPLLTKLQTGQTVEVIAAKSGGPSRDWLNPQLGFLASPRSRAKVRAWFNAIELQQRIAQGQTMVEKELQRLGKTAINM